MRRPDYDLKLLGDLRDLIQHGKDSARELTTSARDTSKSG